jgi:hypothetical protein
VLIPSAAATPPRHPNCTLRPAMQAISGPDVTLSRSPETMNSHEQPEIVDAEHSNLPLRKTNVVTVL